MFREFIRHLDSHRNFAKIEGQSNRGKALEMDLAVLEALVVAFVVFGVILMIDRMPRLNKASRMVKAACAAAMTAVVIAILSWIV
ncbi:hypothetical protein [Roseovarius sp. 2305UL8-3]|uniref:hypothetical protein n=1 Tax=Roseovarius conchicola TaxID=3121636 RepID=UPI003528E63A